MRKLELLAPAKNLTCGIAAINHGADAVYIGAQRFGARAAAGNSVEDIEKLCNYAHQYGAKVYVTVNTIVFDNETDATRELLLELSRINVDAILIQDMAVLEMARGLFALHASTQTDNRTSEKVRWLASQGFSRVVLARELSIDEISAIHNDNPEVELEAFVHGALCVSYSGSCYASQYCFERSANRGECAQFCRMKFDLLDDDGNEIIHQSHLLSLKDMCQIDNLEALAKAGVCSFKIEGRLKDIDYVKNVTAAYSEKLNHLVRKHPDKYQRASYGKVYYEFEPNLQKTFNRGYTTYFANGRQPNIASFDTPKAMGEFVGTVKDIKSDQCIVVSSTHGFSNGDGLCFLNTSRELCGFRVNRAEGNHLYLQVVPSALQKGMRLYRNNDQAFERQLLSNDSAKRKIPLKMIVGMTTDGVSLRVSSLSSSDCWTEATIVVEHQIAEKSQRENIIRQLSKLGDTSFECSDIVIPESFNLFVPSSRWVELRRKALDELISKSNNAKAPNDTIEADATSKPGCIDAAIKIPEYKYQYCYNVSNNISKHFYAKRGLNNVDDAFEINVPRPALLMQCRHCLRFALGHCVKNGGIKPNRKEPLCLRLSDGRRFRLEFDCKNCQMNVYANR